MEAPKYDSVYVFPHNLRSVLKKQHIKSLVVLSWTDYVWPLLFLLLRFSFGIALIFSALLVAVAVVVVLAALAAGNREGGRSK